MRSLVVAGVALWSTLAQVIPLAAQSVTPWSTHLRVQTPFYSLSATGVEVPEYRLNDTPGAPALPVWRTVVELPPDGDWAITYQAPGTELLDQPIDVAAVPVPDLPPRGPVGWMADSDLPDAVPVADRPDPAIYAANEFYPPLPVVAGEVQWHQGRRLLPVRVFPFQYNPVSRQLRYHPDVQITIALTSNSPAALTGQGRQTATTGATNAAAMTTGALRIRTGERGLYRLTYDDLLAAGVPLASTDTATFAMSYLGQPVAIEVTGDGDDRFEPGELVIFYAQPYQGRYQADNVYWFTYGGSPGLPMATRTVTPSGSEPLITIITQTLHVEFDREYRNDYPRPKEADHWFDTPMSPVVATGVLTVTRPYDLALDDALTNGVVQIEATLQGGTDRPQSPDQSVELRLNGYSLGRHQWEGLTYTTIVTQTTAAWLNSATPNVLTLEAAISQLPGIDLYSFSPDWIDVTYPAFAEAENDRIYVEGVVSGANKIAVSGFTTPDVAVYDLRVPNQPVRLLTTQAVANGGTYTLNFWDADLPGPSYYLSSQAALLAPLAIEPDTPSSWGTPDHQADYIAIVHSSLWNAIQPLLDHRTADGLQVAKVDVQDIYDEFSYGRRDPEAIRSFLSYAYHQWNNGGQPPQYVLLVGDGHYDFTGVSGTPLPNLIPPYLIDIDPYLGETAADNRYVSVDGPDDYLPEMHIGRIPAASPADVAAVVDKIIAYETTAPGGDWQQRVVYVADNNLDPIADFHALSDDVRLNWLPAAYDDRTIYYNRDYFTGGDMRAAIKAAFNADAIMLQWFGHASRFRWGSVSMFNTLDLTALSANDTWPFTATYSCWAGYFINLFIFGNGQSLGETLLLTPQRGSVADLSPSGLHVGSALLTLNQGLTRELFQNRTDRVGQAVDGARLFYFANSSSFRDLIDTSVLFGDPALKLRLPDPLLATSSLEANREWVPPGLPVTVTATLTNTGAVSTTGVLTLTLPPELGAPTTLTATSGAATYDPGTRQVTWTGDVITSTAEAVTFSSPVAAGLTACGQITVAGQVKDGLAAVTPLAAAVQLAVPDVTCDGAVNVADVQQVAARWGEVAGSAGYDPRYDLDGDDQIGVLDVIIAASRWQ